MKVQDEARLIDEVIDEILAINIEVDKGSLGSTISHRIKLEDVIVKAVNGIEKAPAMRISPKGLGQVYKLLADEMNHGRRKFGEYTSPHHLFAVLLEEVDEFWETVKANKPDYGELLQIAAVALRGYIEGMHLNRDAKVENVAYD